MSSFNELPIRSYLGLDADAPGPSASPVEFLSAHLRQLPPHLLLSFSVITTPKDRTQIAAIRNRRLKYADTDPPEFQFASARSTWPLLYEGQERRGRQEGEDEKDWVARDFLQGLAKHVGHLGTLLGGYEEEREAERFRALRRERAEVFIPEEESDSDDEEPGDATLPEPTADETKASFLRLIRERFIYGLLEEMDYDKVDWDENLDVDDDREAEEKWFDDDDDE